MRENKDAAPRRQHRDGEERADAGCAGMYGSEAHFNTQRGRISSVLAAFREPVTAAELAAALGVRDQRAISRMVQWERQHGAPICASCDPEKPGFYLARNPGELDRYLKSLDHRIGEISDTYTAMARMRDEWRGQLRIEGWETNDGEE